MNEFAIQNYTPDENIERLAEATKYFSCIFEETVESLIGNNMLDEILKGLQIGSCGILFKKSANRYCGKRRQ